MDHDLRDFRLEKRVLLGNCLQLDFCGKSDEEDRRVLNLENVTACLDRLAESTPV